MKRKIIVVAMLMTLIACLFAIATSAAEIPEWTDITEVEGMSDKSVFGDDGKSGATSRVLMSDGKTYPAYYICKNQASLSFDLDTLSKKVGTTYTKSSIVRLEIPKGTTSIPDSAFNNSSGGFPNIVSVEIPYGVTSIGQTAFRTSPISNPIVLPETVTTIKPYAFKGSKIPSVVIPSSVTTFGTDSFSECPNLSEVYCKSATIPEKAFFDDDNLTVIKLENTVTIGTQAFCNPNGGYINVTSLELPNTVTSIGQYAFTRTKITSLVIPASVTSMGMGAFLGSTSLESVVVLGSMLGAQTFDGCTAFKKLVLTENFETFSTSALGTTPNNSTFITYYTGEDYNRILTLGSSTSRFYSAKVYEYEDYKENEYNDTFMMVWGANLCEVAFDGAHVEDNNPCVINCDRCSLKGVAEENPVHSEILSDIKFENGFNNIGKKITTCQNNGCLHSVSADIDAIFECLGFSTSPDNTGISTGFVVNAQSLDEYEKFIGKKLTFGVVIFNPKYLANGDIFTQDGKLNASKGALQVEFDLEYPIYNLSVSGMSLENSAHTALELVFAGYAYQGKDTSSIQTFQKDYVGTQEKPISSPMASKVTRGDSVLYTIKLQTVLTPAQISFGKEGLNEF